MEKISGYDYEYLWALYLKCMGYGVKVTRKSGDEGADVIGIKDYKKIAYQCKFHSKPVGRDAIYQVHAGKDTYKCSKAIVVTNNTFTKQAKETAEKLSVGLLSHKTPENLIEVCTQSYKEGKIKQEDELFLQLPIAIREAIKSGNKNESENVDMNVVRERPGELYHRERIAEVIETGCSGKTKKVCPICGREFFEHSVMCPICKRGLVSLDEYGGGKRENKANAVSGVKAKNKKNRKLFYFCIGVAVFLYVCIFFMAVYSSFEMPLHTEKIQVTVSSKDLKGINYVYVVKMFQDAGFTDIELIEDADLIFGLLKQEGEVGEVSINGKLSFEKNEYFPKDAKIKIAYHTFQETEEDEYEAGAKTGMDIVTISGHPVFFDTTEKGEQVWSDYLGREVLLPGTEYRENKTEKTIISATGHSTWGMRLGHIDIFLYNTDTGSVDLNAALVLTKQYLPIDLMKQYYKLEESYITESDGSPENETIYIYHINYKITEEGYELREQTKEKSSESSIREYYSMPCQIYISLSGKDTIDSIQIREKTYKSDRETYYKKNGLKKTEWYYDFLE